MNTSHRNDPASIAAATRQLLTADRDYQTACQQFEQRAAQLREELVGPPRRRRLLAIHVLAELTSPVEVSRVPGCPIGRARQLIAEAKSERGRGASRSSRLSERRS